MAATRRTHNDQAERWLLGGVLTCCLAMVLGLTALLIAGRGTWLSGGLGLAGLVLLGAGGGLLAAHLLLDERGPRPPSPRL